MRKRAKANKPHGYEPRELSKDKVRRQKDELRACEDISHLTRKTKLSEDELTLRLRVKRDEDRRSKMGNRPQGKVKL